MAATYITFSSLLHSLNSSKSLSSKEYQPNVVNLNLRNALGKPQRKLSLTFCQPKKAESFESLYTDELNMRKMLEEELKKQKEELVSMISQRDSLNEELQRALDLEKSIDSQLEKYEVKIRTLKEKLQTQEDLLRDYTMQHIVIGRNEADLKKKRVEGSNFDVSKLCSEFSFAEIKEATDNFNPSLKIGEGGYGIVYKGFLRHNKVAIKVWDSNSRQGSMEFRHEVEILSRLRHPNLITLIGANPESMSLVYEYLPKGNLERQRHHLSWQDRISIAADLCSALIFLHSSQPHSIVHGDVNPANINLNANFVAKLSDFGTCRILSKYKDSTQFWKTNVIKGTQNYMDPEFTQSLELTTKSDVYAFGVVLLYLLTGFDDSGTQSKVKSAVETGKLASILDPLAGDWPSVQAEQLARSALQCCEKDRKSRPDLHSDIGRMLNAMRDSFR